MTAFPIVANATHSVIANTVGVKQPSSDGEGDLDCRVGLQPSRNDGVFLGIANTTTVIASRAAAWQPSSDGEGDLDCRVGLLPSRNDGVFLGIVNTTTVIANTVGVKQSR